MHVCSSAVFCFSLLSKGVFSSSNYKRENRLLVLQTLLDNGLSDLLHEYWDATIAEFELRKKDVEPGLSTGQLWNVYASSHTHIVVSLNNIYQIMIVFWNGSDLEVKETLKTIYDSTADFILQGLNGCLYPVEVDSKHAQFKIIRSFLGTLHNFCYKYAICVPDLRLKDALRIVSRYRNAGTSAIKTKTILVSSYLLTEMDSSSKAVVELEQSDINFLIKVLQDALRSTNEMSRTYGYHAEELICGLDNIAVVDSNKRLLVQAGVLPLYVTAMHKNNPELQQRAARAIWTLAFDDENLQKIKAQQDCMNSE